MLRETQAFFAPSKCDLYVIHLVIAPGTQRKSQLIVSIFVATIHALADRMYSSAFVTECGEHSELIVAMKGDPFFGSLFLV